MTTENKEWQSAKDWLAVTKKCNLKSRIDLVKYPVLTEKTATILSTKRQYTFDVDKRLTKTQIKALFENLFQVNVIGVNTHIPPRKTVRVGLARGYRPSFKRAIITLKENQKINYDAFYKAAEEAKIKEESKSELTSKEN